MGFPGGSDGKESAACNAEDLGSIPGLGRSPGEGNGTNSSVLAWKIPQTEVPGRLQSKVVLRVIHNGSGSMHTQSAYYTFHLHVTMILSPLNHWKRKQLQLLKWIVSHVFL